MDAADSTATMDAPTTVKGRSKRLPRAIEADEFRLFAAAGCGRSVLPGDQLFRRGEHGRSLYVIESGEVRLSFNEDVAEKVLGPDQYFGELAVFIGDHLRSGGAVVESAGIIHEISRTAFDQLLAREPLLMADFMRRSFAYLVASETHLVQGLRQRNEDLLQTLDNLRQTRSALDTAQQLVRTDELTGLPNRRGLYTYIEDMAKLPPSEHPRALLLIDIDGFKQINDRCGHLAGDSALRAVSAEISNLAGTLELPCRLGGDEFALLGYVSDAGDLSNRAISLISAVRMLRVPALRDYRLSISVGCVLCGEGGWSAWYSAADDALYQAKGGGGDGWRLAVRI